MKSSSLDTGRILVDFLLKCHQMEKHIASSARMTVDELHCLSLLYTQKPRCIRELGEMLGVRSTRMSKLLNSLEEKGYIIRNLSVTDRRVEDVTLTPRGVHSIETTFGLAAHEGVSFTRWLDPESGHFAPDFFNDPALRNFGVGASAG